MIVREPTTCVFKQTNESKKTNHLCIIQHNDREPTTCVFKQTNDREPTTCVLYNLMIENQPLVSLAHCIVRVVLVVDVLLVHAVIGQVHKLVTKSFHGRRIPAIKHSNPRINVNTTESHYMNSKR